MKTDKVVRVGVIAALYTVITIIFAPISFGLTQIRISEALTILPFIFPESVAGLFLGCFIANIYGGLGIIDVVFGSLATLLAAYLTQKMPSPLLAPLPPVVVNAVIIAYVLYYTLGYPLLPSMLYVGIGQFLSCYLIGLPLLFLLKKYLPK